MGFSTTRETTSYTPLEKEKKRDALKFEVDTLGSILAKYKKEKEELELEKQNRQLLGASSSSIKSEIDIKIGELAILNKEISKSVKQLNELKGIEDKIDKVREDLLVLEFKAKDFEGLEEKIENKKKELSILEEMIKKDAELVEKYNKRFAENEAEEKKQIAEKLEKIKNLEKDIKKLETSKAELEKEEKERKLDVESLKKETIDLEKSLVDKEKVAKDKLKEGLLKMKADFDEECVKKESLLQEREGKCSSWDDRLKGKENELRSLKIELEKFYNRPINHIKI